MADPIISPWVLYAYNLLLSIRTAAELIIIFGAILYVVLGSIVFFDFFMNNFGGPGDSNRDEDFSRYAYILKNKYLLSVLGSCIAICILIPTKEILLAMIVANYITPDNIMITEDHIVELINKIVRAVSNGIKD